MLSGQLLARAQTALQKKGGGETCVRSRKMSLGDYNGKSRGRLLGSAW